MTERLGRGDSGFTDLFGPERVPKYDDRVEAYGTLDEATSALGLARVECTTERARELLLGLQEDLSLAMAEIATPGQARARLRQRLGPGEVARLEEAVRALEQEVSLPRAFIVPGASRASAVLDLARAITRRAERQVVKLAHNNQLENPQILRYLNRASSLLFILARYEEARQGIPYSLLRQRHGR